jgi:hypothetical protein
LQAAGALTLTTLVAVLALYSFEGYWGLRQLMFTVPLVAVAAFSARAVQVVHSRMTDSDVCLCEHTAVLEQLEHDDRQALVAPIGYSIEYVYLHHPVKWSFVPANRATLELLAEHYEIGTVVLPQPDPGTALTPGDLAAIGLVFKQVAQFGDQEVLVFQRPDSAGHGAASD